MPYRTRKKAKKKIQNHVYIEKTTEKNAVEYASTKPCLRQTPDPETKVIDIPITIPNMSQK
jgi:hypothetical protein